MDFYEATDFRTPADAAMESEEYEGEQETIDLAGIRGIPRDALGVMLSFLIGPLREGRVYWPSALKRLIALASQAGCQGVADQSLAYHASKIGATRAALSHHAIRVVDELRDSKVRGGKSRASRETYRQSAILSHQKRGNRIHGHQSAMGASDADDELACVDPTGTP